MIFAKDPALAKKWLGVGDTGESYEGCLRVFVFVTSFLH